ncbi:flap endonuclease-1 [Candidatus Micrarchaeota archaeon]|nr:flap endonuclease-1 [Candidatus Micrarchaeota archaeon]
MGVDLGGILQKQDIELAQARGVIAVDAFNILYQFLTIIRQPDGTPLMDSKGRITSHLSGLFYRTCNLLEAGVKPVYVFDGKSSELKNKTKAKREELKQQAEEARKKAVEEGRVEEAAMLAQRTARLNSQMIEESKQLLSLMGLPFVEAPSEGEAQCAFMAKSGVASAAASQDMDALLFAAPVLLKNITISGKRKLPRKNVYVDVFPEKFVLQENLDALGISQEKLIWIGLLCGTDFNEGVHGIGAKKGLKLVKELDSFDAILEKLGQSMDWRPVFDLFAQPNVKQVGKSDLEFKELRKDELIEFMHAQRDFSLTRIESSLEKAFSLPGDSNQSSLKKWF